jgi:hypothetical protein
MSIPGQKMKDSKKLTKLTFFKIIFVALVVAFVSCNQKNQTLQDNREQAINTKTFTASSEMPIWTKSIPDSELITGEETYSDGIAKNVSNPTIKIFSPIKENSGAAVIVFPGGGYTKVAVDLEGSEICEWLASIGVTGILLKYRVPDSGPHYYTGPLQSRKGPLDLTKKHKDLLHISFTRKYLASLTHSRSLCSLTQLQLRRPNRQATVCSPSAPT